MSVQASGARKRVLGQEHPDTLNSMDNLASTYRNQGRWEKAEQLLVKVMETRKRVLGQNIQIHCTLASMHIQQRRWNEAEELYIQITNSNLGEDHPSTLAAFVILDLIRMNRKRLWRSSDENGLE